MRYMDNQARSVLIGERMFNETELACRLEVELEKYTMKVQIESRVLGDLAINHIVPTAVIYRNQSAGKPAWTARNFHSGRV